MNELNQPFRSTISPSLFFTLNKPNQTFKICVLLIRFVKHLKTNYLFKDMTEIISNQLKEYSVKDSFYLIASNLYLQYQSIGTGLSFHSFNKLKRVRFRWNNMQNKFALERYVYVSETKNKFYLGLIMKAYLSNFLLISTVIYQYA